MKKALHCIGWLLVACTAAQLALGEPMSEHSERALEKELPVFLGTASTQNRITVAARLVNAIISQPQNDKIAHDLATVTGGLIGAASKDAPAVAAALLQAGGTNYAPVVRAAVLLDAPKANLPDDLLQATLASVTQRDSSAPAPNLDEELQGAVVSAAEFFALLRDNWDPAQSAAKKGFFADRDGGETPCPRDQ